MYSMEQYKSIPNFETYGIDCNGNVIDFRSGKIKPSYLNDDGYYRVQLKNPSGEHSLSISRLVGLTYIPNPNNYKTIDHIDRNRSNNNISNLRWATTETQSQNRQGWGHLCKFVFIEKPHIKNPSTSYRIQIRNSKLKFSKRFNTKDYSYEYVKDFRDKLLLEHNIEIID